MQGVENVPTKDRKLNKGKPSIALGFLLKFPRAAVEVARVSVLGGIKYDVPPDDQNFLGARSVDDYLDADARHTIGHYFGPVNLETGGSLPPEGMHALHLAQKAWSSLAALENFLLVLEEEGRTVEDLFAEFDAGRGMKVFGTDQCGEPVEINLKPYWSNRATPIAGIDGPDECATARARREIDTMAYGASLRGEDL